MPTEAEWQLAAVGPPALGNIYPWGPEWDVDNHPWLANTAESGLEECTSVGLYPAGASCNGVMDMAGTLWEWCANAFDDPDTIGPPEHGKDMRVIRGGTWNRTREYARCTYREGFFPYGINNMIGFRVVSEIQPEAEASLRVP